AGFSFFLLLIRRNEILKFQHRITEERYDLTKLETKALGGDYSEFGNGTEYGDVEHPYAHDLDILGNKSFFQSLNRTGSKKGESQLADWTLDKKAFSEPLDQRQKAIIELSDKIEFRQNFYIYGKIYGSRDQEDLILKKWFSEFTPKYTSLFLLQIYRFLMPALSLLALGLYVAGI